MISTEIPLTPNGCRLVQENLDTADFNVALQLAIISHCQKCAGCQKYSQQLNSLRTLLMSQVRIQAPKDFDIKLRQKIAASKNSQLITSPWWQWVSQPAFGVALAAVTFVGVLVGADYYYYIIGNSNKPQVASSPTLVTETKKEAVISQSATNNTPLLSNVSSRPQPAETVKIVTPIYEAQNRNLPRRFSRPTPNQASRQMALDQVNIEVHYGNSSRTLPLSSITYGSKPVLNVDNVKASETQRFNSLPESRIF